MDKFNIEYQYQIYLERVGLKRTIKKSPTLGVFKQGMN
jgi:hypothetical protein